jgi:anti-sigma B factor antagonist
MGKKMLQIEESGDITIIRVTEKKLYQDTITPFQEKMVSLLDEGRRKLIVDLSEVDVMNSSGLGVLILTWDRLSQQDGNLVIAGLGSLMEELFKRMRLDLIFKVVKTTEEALQIIRGDKKIPAS